MASVIASPPALWTAEDLAERFGPMPLQRFRLDRSLGMATEQDVIDIHDRENRLYELVDGILVEKTMGLRESILAMALIRLLGNFVAKGKLGIVAGPDGTMRLAPGLVRIPDASFFRWDRFPDRRVPSEPIPDVVPNLGVEVLSPSNTAKEMQRKLEDFFAAGVELVWFIDPVKRCVEIFTSPTQSTVLQGNATLDGGSVLPGFSLPLAELFATLDQQG